MKNVSYVFVVSSLMYAQICTHPIIAYVVVVLGRYLSNVMLFMGILQYIFSHPNLH